MPAVAADGAAGSGNVAGADVAVGAGAGGVAAGCAGGAAGLGGGAMSMTGFVGADCGCMLMLIVSRAAEVVDLVNFVDHALVG